MTPEEEETLDKVIAKRDELVRRSERLRIAKLIRTGVETAPGGQDSEVARAFLKLAGALEL